MDIIERLQQDQPLILDGATGTEIQRRGVQTILPEWSASALEVAPEVVRQIHADYATAGADILTTNTFRTHARSLRSSARARQLTQLAVRLAQEAAATVSHRVYVAGSVAPLEDCYSPQLTPAASYCQREHMEMVSNLVGVDFCLIETMNTIHEAHAAALAAHTLGVPFVVSFVLNENFDLLSGETLAAAVARVEKLAPLAVLVNCIPTRHITPALQKLRALTNLPIGAYGNMGTPDDVQGWAFEADIPPHDYCDYAADWLALGAKIVGSCCGSSPAHTRALRARIANSAHSQA